MRELPIDDTSWKPGKSQHPYLYGKDMTLASNRELEPGEADAYIARAKTVCPESEVIYLDATDTSAKLHYALTRYAVEDITRLRSFTSHDEPLEYRGITEGYAVKDSVYVETCDGDVAVLAWSCPNCDHELDDELLSNFCSNCGCRIYWKGDL